MEKRMLLLVLVFGICSTAVMAWADKESAKNRGEAKFKELCVTCHAEGGNIVNPKTLKKSSRRE
jgi:cytochrome c553